MLEDNIVKRLGRSDKYGKHEYPFSWDSINVMVDHNLINREDGQKLWDMLTSCDLEMHSLGRQIFCVKMDECNDQRKRIREVAESGGHSRQNGWRI